MNYMADRRDGKIGKPERKKAKKKKTAKDRILDILLVFFILVALGSGSYLAVYFYQAKTAQDSFDKLKTMIEEDDSDNSSEESTETVVVKDEENKEKTILKKYQAIYDSNKDFVGWVSIDGTNIDYPVMYTPDDPQLYLHTDFEGNWSSPGIPFVDSRCDIFEDRSENIIIYGHNMKSGTMFHSLPDYDDEEFYKEHKFVKFDTLYETGTYEVIGAVRTQIYPEDDTENFHYYDYIDADSKAEFDEFMDFLKENTPYKVDAEAEYGDELLTLSTCAYHVGGGKGRFILVAKRIDDSDR